MLCIVYIYLFLYLLQEFYIMY